MTRSKSVFISYCHRQGDWVWDRLVPCLRAGGADVHVDRERFEAGKAVTGQMDAVQDAAGMAVLVLSPDYLDSRYCVHELKRAVRKDPDFTHGIVIPVQQVQCAWPARIRRPSPLYVDLRDDSKADQWDLLLQACGANLGIPSPQWLNALHETCRFLQRGDSVNLIVRNKPNWRGLIQEVKNRIAGVGEKSI